MFKREDFGRTLFENVPLGRDLYVMDEKWISDFEREWMKHFTGQDADLVVGYISRAVARSIDENWIQLSWYPNIHDRFHEVSAFLPRSEFVACVDIWQYDHKPTIFVRSEWLKELHERPLVSFAIVDAIGIKDLLRGGNLSATSLRQLRDEIDAIADRYPGFAFISFADSLLVKEAWSVGHVDSEIEYTYSPEKLLPVVISLREAFERTLGVPAYAVMTQGLNAYADHEPLHHSANGNHISLNTLGLPFAQLQAIEDAARRAIRAKAHDPAELYLDSTFYRSLKTDYESKKQVLAEYPYRSPMMNSEGATYVATSVQDITFRLQKQKKDV